MQAVCEIVERVFGFLCLCFGLFGLSIEHLLFCFLRPVVDDKGAVSHDADIDNPLLYRSDADYFFCFLCCCHLLFLSFYVCLLYS